MYEQLSDNILFLMLFGGTAMAALIACIYLLLTKGNAFANDVTPPVRLRRWAAAYYAVTILEHILWLLFYLYSGDIHSVIYVVVCVLDCVMLMTTIAGTLLAMLQDRKRPVWPVIIATIPYMALLGLSIVYPSSPLLTIIAIAYIFLIFVLFTVYMVLAVKQYGRWLRDNYADLEHKEVRLSYLLIIIFLLFVILYGLADNITISYIVQLIGLALFGLLLWRVETLQQLDEATQDEEEMPEDPVEVAPIDDPSGIGQLLERHCEDAQLYLQHDLSLTQLSQAVGTNHFYLSKYFTQQGMTYNTYINGLRIRHFIKLYHEAVATQRSFTAQQLAHESGFRSYSTFNTAFKQRMGQTLTAWICDTVDVEK